MNHIRQNLEFSKVTPDEYEATWAKINYYKEENQTLKALIRSLPPLLPLSHSPFQSSFSPSSARNRKYSR